MIVKLTSLTGAHLNLNLKKKKSTTRLNARCSFITQSRRKAQFKVTQIIMTHNLCEIQETSVGTRAITTS